MANKTDRDLRAHLSLFDPAYPIKKGYIACLLLDRTDVDVLREIRNIVQTAEPKKHVNEENVSTNLHHLKNLLKDKRPHLTKEWPSLIRLCLQPFPITFRSILEPHASVQPVHTLKLSSRSSIESELACTATSVEPDIPETSLMQSGTTFTSVKLPSVSLTPCSFFSPKMLKKDCETCVNCVSKQGDDINILE